MRTWRIHRERKNSATLGASVNSFRDHEANSRARFPDHTEQLCAIENMRRTRKVCEEVTELRVPEKSARRMPVLFRRGFFFFGRGPLCVARSKEDGMLCVSVKNAQKANSASSVRCRATSIGVTPCQHAGATYQNRSSPLQICWQPPQLWLSTALYHALRRLYR